MILGLDISTTTIGATVLDENGKILMTEAWEMKNKKIFSDTFVKASHIKYKIKDLHKLTKGEIEHVFIEKPLQRFRPGFSSAKTLSILSSFNGMVSWMCYDIIKKVPEYVSAQSARKLCGIKIPRGQKAKEVVLNFLIDNEPSFVVEYTRYGNPMQKYYDIADSIVVARAGLKYLEQERDVKSRQDKDSTKDIWVV